MEGISHELFLSLPYRKIEPTNLRGVGYIVGYILFMCQLIGYRVSIINNPSLDMSSAYAVISCP